MTPVLSLNPARSDESKAAFAKAMAQGDLAYAHALANSSTARFMSAEEFHAQRLGKALQQAGGVVVIGDTHYAAATSALDKHELVRRSFRRVLYKLKTMISALWTR